MQMPPQKSRSILVVDDDRLVLATLSSGLRDAGYVVYEAVSGEAALAVIAEEDPDIALLDMRMPKMSGLELAQRIGSECEIPFLFLSAYNDTETVQAAAQRGALGYLVKPLEVANILPTLESALARAAEIRRLRESEANLSTALAASRDASMAIGLLMERLRLDRDQAYELLRQYARSQRRKLADVAAEMLNASESLNRLVAHHRERGST